jgi:hypothetical protein
MCAGLGAVLAVPIATDFLALEMPPPPLLLATGLITLGVVAAVELLARLHGRRSQSAAGAALRALGAGAGVPQVRHGQPVKDLHP